MRTLTLQQMEEVDGGQEKGSYCGIAVGATIATSILFTPLAGSLVFMLTPSVCAIDFSR